MSSNNYNSFAPQSLTFFFFFSHFLCCLWVISEQNFLISFFFFGFSTDSRKNLCNRSDILVEQSEYDCMLFGSVCLSSVLRTYCTTRMCQQHCVMCLYSTHNFPWLKFRLFASSNASSPTCLYYRRLVKEIERLRPQQTASASGDAMRRWNWSGRTNDRCTFCALFLFLFCSYITSVRSRTCFRLLHSWRHLQLKYNTTPFCTIYSWMLRWLRHIDRNGTNRIGSRSVP